MLNGVERSDRHCLCEMAATNGDIVLKEMSAMYGWAVVMIKPGRVITGNGLFLQMIFWKM